MTKKKTKIDIDTILMNVLVVLLILISTISLVIIRDYVGMVASHGARGGRITEINVVHQAPATIWNGIFGIAIQAALDTPWYVFANNGEVSELNPIYPCFEIDKVHEIYSTILNETELIWANVTVGNTTMLDNWVGILSNDTMSATQTFNDTISVELGNVTFSNVPAIYMKEYNEPNSTEFPVGILQYNGTPIMVTLINTDYITGFRPDKLVNYEMMVPVPFNSTNLKYYLYVDPYDTCPYGSGGSAEEIGRGEVYGYVTDTDTGQFLENTLVAIDGKIYVTSSDGYYNISEVAEGERYIVATKLGFGNYVRNLTIVEDVSLEHNISMDIVFDQSFTGTGSGVGTGVDDPGTKTKSGDGPGIGPGIGPFIEKPENIGVDNWMSLDRLKKRIRLNNFFTEHLLVFSFRSEPAEVKIQITGDAAEIIELSDTSATIEQNEYANFSVRGYGLEEGQYNGEIVVSGDFNGTIPIEITVSDEERLPVEALLIQLDVLTRRPLPGKNFKFSVNLQNLLIDERYDVRLDYYLRGIESETANNTLYIGNETVSLRTTETVIEEFVIPSEWPKGDYFLIIEANYFDMYSRTTTVFELFEPIQNYKVFGLVELWKVLTVLGVLAFILGLVLYIRREINKRKRFHAKVEYKLLPKKGPRSLYVGKIAETENDTYFDMDKLTVHSIVAGSTGGGKSISAQVIIEECLMKDVAVIVIDPTAQWSGMLRKCQDQKMMSYYPRFHLTKKSSRAFNGNVRAIMNPLEKVDLLKFWKPGEIQVITTSTLDPKGMDIFVANTVRQVFKSNLKEYRGLRFMMVYDEVHRLLPKFGGTGEGFVQIERACREFRKWGIGVMLISQVLADFVGQIKANINTEVQMKTRDESDLARIKDKYGASFIQELVKSPVGSGMVQNSSWNRGLPYYVTFRPILHSVVRLSDEELEKYNKYNLIAEDLEFQLDQLEETGKDVFDLRLELKLSVDKIKQGGFNMVEIYLEGLKPRIEKIWKDLGQEPKHKEVELVSEKELKASIDEAESESKKAKEAAASAVSGDEEEGAKSLGLNDDVAPDQMLKLVNGTLVIKLKALLDEVKVLKEPEFKTHVDEGKNDLSDWIRTAIGSDAWADLADPILTKGDYIKFLEALDSGKEKTFKPTTPRKEPYSSKKEVPVEEKKEDVKGEGKEESKEDKNEESKSDEIKKTETNSEEKVQETSSQEEKKEDESNLNKNQEIQSENKEQELKLAQNNENQKSNESQEEQKGTNFDLNEVRQKLASLQNSEEKINYLLELINKNPNNNDLLFSLASEYHRAQKYDEAEINYKKILERDSGNFKVMYYLASLYSTMKKYDEALELFNKVKAIKPDYQKVQQYLDSINKIKQKATQ
ncbi:DUF87 domain-containing protein [archaeon]|nr:DUF87 domain-containing protein [archaeon]